MRGPVVSMNTLQKSFRRAVVRKKSFDVEMTLARTAAERRQDAYLSLMRASRQGVNECRVQRAEQPEHGEWAGQGGRRCGWSR